MARVFISYKRIEPDSTVARELHQSLTQAGHEVFLDVTMPVGVLWAQRIEAELNRADFLVVLLSEQSVQSEMMIGELGTAFRLKKRLLPVRLAWKEPLKYPLSVWLDPINWAFWRGPEDTAWLVGELERALAGGALSAGGEDTRREVLQPAPPTALPLPLPLASIELESGAMDVESRLYIRREVDALATGVMSRQGKTLNLKGARQMGKSSLLMHLLATALEAGKRVAFIDFQELDSAVLASDDAFFRVFCSTLSERLELKDQVEAYWAPGLGNLQSCGKYMGDYVLKSLGAPLVLALDEVDRLFDSPFRSDFFGMLRSWHNKRAQPTAAAWKKLDLVLVTSTEPYLLVENLNQSPFNVGESFELADFTPEEVTRLNQLHGPALGPEDERRLFALLGGHPYLLRRALYLIATRRMTGSELLTHTDLDGGPFGDHLRHLLFLLHPRQELVSGLCDILQRGACGDATVLHQLRSAGLVRQEGERIVPRCELYTRYFRKHLLG
jgi:AAA-like domain/TIR domain